MYVGLSILVFNLVHFGQYSPQPATIERSPVGRDSQCSLFFCCFISQWYCVVPETCRFGSITCRSRMSAAALRMLRCRRLSTTGSGARRVLPWKQISQCFVLLIYTGCTVAAPVVHLFTPTSHYCAPGSNCTQYMILVLPVKSNRFVCVPMFREDC